MHKPTISFIFALTILSLCLFTVTRGQPPVSEVCVKSWRQGYEKIVPEQISVKLYSATPEFERDIATKSGKRYRLSVVKNPGKALDRDFWQISLRDIPAEGQNVTLGPDLLYADKPGEVRHYFPREDLAPLFFPDERNMVLVNGVQTVDYKAVYLRSVTRKFLVDGFVILVNAGNVALDSTPGKVLSFDMSFQLQNSDSKCTCDSGNTPR